MSVRILYGVEGDGMGHAIRSSVVIAHLSRHHRVDVVASRRAHGYLAARFPNVRRIWGMEHAYGPGRIRRARTLLKAAAGLVSGGVTNLGRMFRTLARERYDLVISDFETFSHLVGCLSGIPVITLDNIQALSRFRRTDASSTTVEHRVADAFVRLTAPFAWRYLVTTFFRAPLGDPRAIRVPPVLRPDILDAEPEPGSHLLVYQTAHGHRELLAGLAGSGLECRCYGAIGHLERPIRHGRLVHKPFDEHTFIDDLRTASAVITNGGFTLISEALHLGKPVLSIPLRHQAEQGFNAYHLARLGYGMAAHRLTPAVLRRFLAQRPRFEAALGDYPRHDNSAVFRHLDRLVAEVPVSARTVGSPPARLLAATALAFPRGSQGAPSRRRTSES
jgi:uncharacterized protein (TIGR00661 family)